MEDVGMKEQRGAGVDLAVHEFEMLQRQFDAFRVGAGLRAIDTVLDAVRACVSRG